MNVPLILESERDAFMLQACLVINAVGSFFILIQSGRVINRVPEVNLG